MPIWIVLNVLCFAEVVENERVAALEKQFWMPVYVGKFFLQVPAHIIST